MLACFWWIDAICFSAVCRTARFSQEYSCLTFCVLVHFNRKPKVEKTKPDREAEQQQQQQQAQKKKKGFLPETKKRQKRTKPVLEPAGEQPTSVDKPGAEKGQARKKNDKKTKRKQAAGEASEAKKRKKQPDSKPAKKSQTAADSNPVKKKKKPKQKKVNGGEK